MDDDEPILKNMKRVLKRKGFNKVISALNAEQGIKLLEDTRNHFFLIMSDQRMPGISGSEFLEKSILLSPESRRMLITGYSNFDAIVDAVNKGEMHQYISKHQNAKLFDIAAGMKKNLKTFTGQLENKRKEIDHLVQALKEAKEQAEYKEVFLGLDELLSRTITMNQNNLAEAFSISRTEVIANQDRSGGKNSFRDQSASFSSEFGALVDLQVSEDRVEAWIRVPKSIHGTTDIGPIKKMIKKRGIKNGIVPDREIRLFIQNCTDPHEKFVVAKGVAASVGSPAQIIYHFNTEHDTAGVIREDGSIDFSSRGGFSLCKKRPTPGEKKAQGSVQAKFSNNVKIFAHGNMMITREIMGSRILISGALNNEAGSMEEKQKLAKELKEIETSIEHADERIKSIFEEQDAVMKKIQDCDNKIEDLNTRIADLKNEKQGATKLLKRKEPITILKINKKLFRGTKIMGTKASTILQYDVGMSKFMEIDSQNPDNPKQIVHQTL